MDISVIICTHNPRQDYLDRVLKALRGQTLPVDQWELLLIDNASAEPLASRWDLSWHPRGRHVREMDLGLTPARFRGIREAVTEVLVFVDDDNVLAPDFLDTALKLTVSHHWVGAFGGNIKGEFEVPPEPWAEARKENLAVKEIKREEWAFSPMLSLAGPFLPIGAGMVIRRSVAAYYVKNSENDPLRRSLDRKGVGLLSGGDVDLVMCASSLGFATGWFPQLQLLHLIAARRLTREYLLRLAEASAFSFAMLEYIWNKRMPVRNDENLCRTDKLFQAYKSWRYRWKNGNKKTFNMEWEEAWQQGHVRAIQALQSEKFEFAEGPVPRK